VTRSTTAGYVSLRLEVGSAKTLIERSFGTQALNS